MIFIDMIWHLSHRILISNLFRGVGPYWYEENYGNYILLTSIVDPNTLNLSADPECWPNLDPDPGLCYLF